MAAKKRASTAVKQKATKTATKKTATKAAKTPAKRATASTPSKPEYQMHHFASARAWREWLHEHHAEVDGVWLRFAKKGSAITSPTYAEALDVALCYGWIDGQVKSHDADSWLQKWTPRRKKSLWSKVNVAKAEELERRGLMQPAGRASVEAAKQDGRWERAYDSASTATVPDDLQAALDAKPKARTFFATLSRTNRYAVIWRVQTASNPALRAKRIADLVAMLSRGETIHS